MSLKHITQQISDLSQELVTAKHELSATKLKQAEMGEIAEGFDYFDDQIVALEDRIDNLEAEIADLEEELEDEANARYGDDGDEF